MFCGIIDLLVNENVKIDKGSETEKSEIKVKLKTEKESETEVELEANNGESEIEEWENGINDIESEIEKLVINKTDDESH
ncbi:unnamed protein product [Rhizophagus irregularis]|nr:unnamed protein product [Rhizophagus irregularis]